MDELEKIQMSQNCSSFNTDSSSALPFLGYGKLEGEYMRGQKKGVADAENLGMAEKLYKLGRFCSISQSLANTGFVYCGLNIHSMAPLRQLPNTCFQALRSVLPQ